MPRVSGVQAQLWIGAAAKLDGYVAALAWSPDGREIAAAEDEGSVAVMRAEDGALAHVTEHAGGALSVDWSARGVLASGGRDGRVTLDGIAGPPARGWVERVSWRPDGGLLAVAQRRTLSFLAPDGELRGVSEEMPATVAAAEWHPKGVLCAAATYGGVRLVRANGAKTDTHLRWTGSVLALAFSPDGRRLAHGNQDASVHFWHLGRGTELEMGGYLTKPRELAWSHDGRWLATGGGPTATLWDFHRPGGPAGSRPVELESHSGLASALDFQPGADLLASAGWDGHVLLWAPGQDDLPIGGSAFEAPVSALAWSPAGDRLAVGCADGTFAVLGTR